MRVMILIKANEQIEAGVLPSAELLNAMGKFNADLVAAGVLLAADGLRPSTKGARVETRGGQQTVLDGPFAETKELISGFWMLDVPTFADALDWARRVPNPHGQDMQLEVREVSEAEDFGDVFTPEMRAAEDRLREQISGPAGP